mgnify:CR=1 FL=1
MAIQRRKRIHTSGPSGASGTARTICADTGRGSGQQKGEVNAACEAMIVSGVNVTLADGTVEHFDLKERDQLNLFGKQIQVNAGLESIEYHTDTTPTTNCKYYSNADMQSIIQAAMWHVSYHQTYCISPSRYGLMPARPRKRWRRFSMVRIFQSDISQRCSSHILSG